VRQRLFWQPLRPYLGNAWLRRPLRELVGSGRTQTCGVLPRGFPQDELRASEAIVEQLSKN